MGWKSTKAGRVMQDATNILATLPDELLAACVFNAILAGGGLMIGQTRNRTVVTIRLYEPGEIPETVYANTSEELKERLAELLDYLRAKIPPPPAQSGRAKAA